jgi:hypothetical protein
MCRRVLRVTEDDHDGVSGVDDGGDVRTAPLGVLSGAVVGVVTVSSARRRDGGRVDADLIQSEAISAMATRAAFSSTMA